MILIACLLRAAAEREQYSYRSSRKTASDRDRRFRPCLEVITRDVPVPHAAMVV